MIDRTKLDTALRMLADAIVEMIAPANNSPNNTGGTATPSTPTPEPSSDSDGAFDGTLPKISEIMFLDPKTLRLTSGNLRAASGEVNGMNCAIVGPSPSPKSRGYALEIGANGLWAIVRLGMPLAPGVYSIRITDPVKPCPTSPWRDFTVGEQ